MTRNDFMLHAIISMASKVIGNNGITDSGDWENVVNEVRNLTYVVEKEIPHAFSTR